MKDPKVTKAAAEGRLPEGITEAFLNESKDKPATIAIIVVTILASCVVICRLVSRAFVVKRIGVDDGLAMGSLVGLFDHPAETRSNVLHLGMLHCICRPLYRADPTGFRTPLCVHPIHP